MRLIDADKLLDILKEMHGIERTRYDDGLDTAEAVIDVAETIDPVKHGHWYIISHSTMFKNRICRCSICRCDRTFDDDTWLDPFCPECGAKMDEKEDVNNG